MPKVNTDPDTLRPYIYHGVDLQWSNGAKDAYGTCPFCGGESKFSVMIEKGIGRCVKCNIGTKKGGMNAVSFIRLLLQESLARTSSYQELLDSRGILDPSTFKDWGVAKSVGTGEWIVAGYNLKGEVITLYKYVLIDGKYRLLPTPTMGHALFGLGVYDAAKPETHVYEGPWDGMASYEVLKRSKLTGNGYMTTTNETLSLLADVNVLAVPGCNVFQEGWSPLFNGKRVSFFYDNDHPKTDPKTKKEVGLQGLLGMQKHARIIESSKTPPESIRYLNWGDEGFDATLESGTDVRDILKAAGDTTLARMTALEGLLSRLTFAPSEWFSDGGKNLGKAAEASEGGALKSKPCNNYATLVNAWRKAMKWTPGLEHGLVSCLASVTSTDSVGSQLWLKLIGPASCGKTTIAEGISVAKFYVYAKSTIRGFHSGFKYLDPNTQEEIDISLAELVRGKTLVTKDGDTLIQAPNLGQILAEARDIYDRVARTSYRNGQGKDYENHSMTWILCGTSSLRSIDSSELGERFLDCVIMEEIDDELEDEILWRVVNKADRNLSLRTTGDAQGQYPPELMEAMQLTGGYVEYLRENSTDIISTVESPEWALRRCTRLGKFIAFMRARPSSLQEEQAERELAARLVEQIHRYAKCTAVVLNRSTMDEEVMQRATKIALDTSRGVTLDIAKRLYESNDEGLEPKTLSYYTNIEDGKLRSLLKFLRQIGVAENFVPAKSYQGITPKPKWRLTAKLHRLYSEVMGHRHEVTANA